MPIMNQNPSKAYYIDFSYIIYSNSEQIVRTSTTYSFIRQKNEILKINIVFIKKGVGFMTGMIIYRHQCLFFDAFGHFHIVF